VIKTITHAATGRQFRLGRRRPVARCRALALGNYLMRSYAPPPATADWTAAAAAALAKVYLNDRLGDCVIAWGGHLEGVLTGNAAGAPIIYTDAQIEGVYSAVGGYVPGDPSTDDGCDEETFLNYIQASGFAGGTKIDAWIRVNAADPQEVRAAIDLFGAITITMELPDAWLDNDMPTGPGFTWDVAGDSDPENGHCVGSASYQPGKVGLSTWGMYGWLTDAALAAYAVPRAGGGCYVVLSEDWINKTSRDAPPGFDFSQLQADIASMAA